MHSHYRIRLIYYCVYKTTKHRDKKIRELNASNVKTFELRSDQVEPTTGTFMDAPDNEGSASSSARPRASQRLDADGTGGVKVQMKEGSHSLCHPQRGPGGEFYEISGITENDLESASLLRRLALNFQGFGGSAPTQRMVARSIRLLSSINDGWIFVGWSYAQRFESSLSSSYDGTEGSASTSARDPHLTYADPSQRLDADAARPTRGIRIDGCGCCEAYGLAETRDADPSQRLAGTDKASKAQSYAQSYAQKRQGFWHNIRRSRGSRLTLGPRQVHRGLSVFSPKDLYVFIWLLKKRSELGFPREISASRDPHRALRVRRPRRDSMRIAGYESVVSNRDKVLQVLPLANMIKAGGMQKIPFFLVVAIYRLIFVVRQGFTLVS